jgi:HlyD family secretion protein
MNFSNNLIMLNWRSLIKRGSKKIRGVGDKALSLGRRFWGLKFRWKLLLFILGLFLLGRGYFAYQRQEQAAARSEIVAVEREDLVHEAVRSGKVELQGVIDVKPPLSGVLVELRVENGQLVAQGDVLFKVKSTASEAQQAAAWSSFLAAQNAYEEAKINIGNNEWASFESAKQGIMAAEMALEQYEKDHRDKLTEDNKEYQQLIQSLKISRLNVETQVQIPARIDARLEQARMEYLAASASYQASKDGTYKAPTAGRVENLGVNVGENIVADVGDKSGTPLFLLVPAGKKTVSMQIGANDAMTLKVGQTANIRSNLVKETDFLAEIVRVDKVGRTSESGLSYRAWLEVDDISDQLLLGTPVEISIKTGEALGALVVPSLAVVEGEVTIVDEDGAVLEKRTVEVGLKGRGKVEIVSGVAEGELVLVRYSDEN